MATKITDHYFKHNTIKYFRGKADDIELATFGQKKDPIGAKSYVAKEGNVSRKHLVGRVDEGKPVSISWSDATKATLEINGQLQVFGLDLGATAKPLNYKDISRTNLKLYNLSIGEGQLKKMLNNDANAARNFLAEEGKDGRIVSNVWLVMEAETAEYFSSVPSLTFSVNGSALNLTAKGGKQGTRTLSLTGGDTFAYGLHKVKKWNKGKTQIENMEDDYKGMN